MKVKLVRDKISARGPREVVRPCNTPAGLHALLVAKLHEEAQEVADDASCAEEYGDLLEVMMRLAELNGVPWTDILVARDEKRREKGGFDRGLVLIRS